MYFFIFIALVVIFFVLGIACLFKAYLDSSDVEKAEVVKIEEDLQAKSEKEKKLSADLVSVRKELETAKTRVEEAKKLEDELTTLQDKENRSKDEIRKLKMDVNEITRKTDQQARDALDIIETLKKESTEAQNSQEESEEIAQKIEVLNTDNEQLKKELQEKADNLERLKGDLASVHSTEEKRAQDALEIIDQLKEENETLKSIENEGDEASGQIDKLSAEVEELKAQLEEERSRAPDAAPVGDSSVEEEEAAIPSDEPQEAPEVTSPAEIPRDSSDDEFKELYSDFKAQLDKMRQTVNELKSEGGEKEGDPNQGELEENLQKLKEINNFLVEKEKILQHELKKSRVEAMGLKQICEDFKIQLEQKAGTSNE